jgi:hypothetical protein
MKLNEIENLTASQKIKVWIIKTACGLYDLSEPEFLSDDFDEFYDDFSEEFQDAIQDAEYECRCGGVDCNLDLGIYSRHYEVDTKAHKMHDGSWVAWPYFYGGGKHGDPDSYDWVSAAKNVNCTEKEVVKIERDFTISE